MSPPDADHIPESTRWPRRRTLLLSLALLLLAGGVLSLPAVHWRLIGWWRGEAFYQGRPTSYWSRQIRKWPGCYSFLGFRHCVEVRATGLDRFRQIAGLRNGNSAQPDILGPDEFGMIVCHWERRDSLDSEAMPVLIELLDDERWWVRISAAQAFALNTTSDRRAVPALVALWHRAAPNLDNSFESSWGRTIVANALRRLDQEAAVGAGIIQDPEDK